MDNASFCAIRDALDPLAAELKQARAACDRSKSKKNITRFLAAQEAFTLHLEVIDCACRELEAAEAAEERARETARQQAEDFLQPRLI